MKYWAVKNNDKYCAFIKDVSAIQKFPSKVNLKRVLQSVQEDFVQTAGVVLLFLESC